MEETLIIQSHQANQSEIAFASDWRGLGEWIGLHAQAVWVIYDRSVEDAAHAIVGALKDQSIRILGVHGLAVDETLKSLHSLATWYPTLVEDGVTRDALIVAIGGGVLTDFAGYAAASYLRGIRWVAVPTTLLAQVDASIGGKVAVNLPQGKNLIGAFHLPSLVYINPSTTLKSLPLYGWQTGLGEVVKSALIEGGALWKLLLEGLPPLGQMNDRWETVIRITAQIKIDVVNRDLEEKGERIFLNFGHTLAHAIEQVAGYGQWSHGQAVAVGSLFALYLSERHLGLDREVRRVVSTWLGRWGLPTSLPSIDYAVLEPILMHDKKARLSGLQWILLERPGKPVVVSGLPRSLLEEALAALS